MRERLIACAVLINAFLGANGIFAQTPTPPSCSVTGGSDNSYGSSTDVSNIESAMYGGSASLVLSSIGGAKYTRNTSVGCHDQCIVYDTTVSSAAPTMSQLVSLWNTYHEPGLANFNGTCGPLGRVWGSEALAGYYAIEAAAANGNPYGIVAPSLSTLAPIANAFVGTQYGPASIASSTTLPLYAYQMGAYAMQSGIPPTDACYPLRQNYQPPTKNSCGQSVTGDPDPVKTYCTAYPSLCVQYTNGLYGPSHSGGADTFRVGDIVNPTNLQGDLAYDEGWAGIMMQEAAIQGGNTNFSNSFELAAQFAESEAPVRDHNYTAKLIWILAEAYDWTGNNGYKAALYDKLNRGLLPGVLTDITTTGVVDNVGNSTTGYATIPFSSLWTVAQPPGRMWDGHNSLQTYMPMNAWALAEAYVALRDRGNSTDQVFATNLKNNYLFPMLDNIATEINTEGMPHVSASNALYGTSQLPYAFLIALWKIDAYENHGTITHTNWDQALSRLWNAAISTSAGLGDQSVNLALYMLYKGNVAYVPLSQRVGTYPTMNAPVSVSILSGTASLSGPNSTETNEELASLLSDDQDYLTVTGSSTPEVGAAFNLPPLTSVNGLTVTIATKSTVASTPRSLYLWNFQTSTWTQIGSDTVGTTEKAGVITVNPTSLPNFTNYIQNYGSTTSLQTVEVGIEQQQVSTSTMSVNFMQVTTQ